MRIVKMPGQQCTMTQHTALRAKAILAARYSRVYHTDKKAKG